MEIDKFSQKRSKVRLVSWNILSLMIHQLELPNNVYQLAADASD